MFSDLRTSKIEVPAVSLEAIRPLMWSPTAVAAIALLAAFLALEWPFMALVAVIPVCILWGQATKFENTAKWAEGIVRWTKLQEELEDRLKSDDLEGELKKVRCESAPLDKELHEWVNTRPTFWERAFLSRTRREPEMRPYLHRLVRERSYIDSSLVDAVLKQRRETRKARESESSSNVAGSKLSGANSLGA
jgi:hypothetical protein